MKIIGVGAYTPEKILKNSDLETMVDTSDEWIFSRTGIKERRVVTDEKTSDLATKASQKLLEKYNIDPKTIDAIILTTMTPDMLTPSTASLVQERIGAINAFSFDMSVACSGFVYGLTIANGLFSDRIKRILLISCETMSKITDFTDRNTCILFGDGAGCVLLEQDETLFGSKLETVSSYAMSLSAKHIKNRSPFNSDPEPKIDFIDMNGRDILKAVTLYVPKNIENMLKENGLEINDVDYVIPHQANIRLIEVLSQKTAIPIELFYSNIDRFGNTSSASIPIALNELVENNVLVLGSKKKILLTGYGAGFSFGSCIITI
ncbi:MAG: beta-ketoacyl-ACP synthase III [Lachnospirales bacterium]